MSPENRKLIFGEGDPLKESDSGVSHKAVGLALGIALFMILLAIFISEIYLSPEPLDDLQRPSFSIETSAPEILESDLFITAAAYWDQSFNDAFRIVADQFVERYREDFPRESRQMKLFHLKSYYFSGDYGSARPYAQRLQREYVTDREFMSDLYFYLGYISWNQENYSRALNEFRDAKNLGGRYADQAATAVTRLERIAREE